MFLCVLRSSPFFLLPTSTSSACMHAYIHRNIHIYIYMLIRRCTAIRVRADVLLMISFVLEKIYEYAIICVPTSCTRVRTMYTVRVVTKLPPLCPDTYKQTSFVHWYFIQKLVVPGIFYEKLKEYVSCEFNRFMDRVVYETYIQFQYILNHPKKSTKISAKLGRGSVERKFYFYQSAGGL